MRGRNVGGSENFFQLRDRPRPFELTAIASCLAAPGFATRESGLFQTNGLDAEMDSMRSIKAHQSVPIMAAAATFICHGKAFTEGFVRVRAVFLKARMGVMSSAMISFYFCGARFRVPNVRRTSPCPKR